MLCDGTKKEPVSFETGSLAGALGLEPRTKVLETHVLPLHHTPMSSRDFYILTYSKLNVKGVFEQN